MPRAAASESITNEPSAMSRWYASPNSAPVSSLILAFAPSMYPKLSDRYPARAAEQAAGHDLDRQLRVARAIWQSVGENPCDQPQ